MVAVGMQQLRTLCRCGGLSHFGQAVCVGRSTQVLGFSVQAYGCMMMHVSFSKFRRARALLSDCISCSPEVSNILRSC